MARQKMEITTKRIKAGEYNVTREDGEMFFVMKGSGEWVIERQSDYRVFGAPTFGVAKYDIQHNDLV